MSDERVELTGDEWLRLVDGQREDSDLPICCANVSELRDALINLMRNGGKLDPFNKESLKRKLTWVFPEHGDDVPASIQKIMDAYDVQPYSGDDIEETIAAEYTRSHAKLRFEF